VKDFGVEPELIEGRGGVFDVVMDGEMIFSKRAAHRFPEPDEVAAAIRARRTGRG